MMRIRFLAASTVVSLAALALAACSGGSSSATDSTARTGQPATIEVASNASLGSILDDADGRTLYLFAKDSGTMSTCTAACASLWPPLRARGNPTVGDGVSAARVDTTPRSDGAPQVTYNGHPLYTYAGDPNPGDTNGQGLTTFGGGWFALSPAGNQVSGTASDGGVSGY